MTLTQQADRLAGQTAYDSAIVLLDSAYRVAVAEFGESDSVVARIAEQTGACCLGAQQGECAAEWYARALAARRLIPTKDSLEVGRLKRCLGDARLLLDQKDAAESLYLGALAILNDTSASWQRERALCLHSLARRYARWGRFPEAEPHLREAYGIYRHLGDNEGAELGSTAYDLGGVYIYAGEFARAESFLDTSIIVLERTAVIEQQTLAEAYYRMASVKERLGDYEASLSLALRSYDLMLEALGPDHKDIAAEQRSIGNIYMLMGRFDKAESWLKQARETYARVLGPECYFIPNCLRDLARLALRRQNATLAEVLIDSALNLQERLFDPGWPGIGRTLELKGEILLTLGRPEQAEESLLRTVEIEKNYWGERHLDVASTLQRLGDCMRLSGDLTASMEFYRQSFDIRFEHLARNSVILAEAEALRLARFLRDSFDGCLSALVDSRLQESTLIHASLPIILAAKGQISDQIFDRHRYFTHSGNSEAHRLFEQYRDLVGELAQMHYRQGDTTTARAADSLSRIVNDRERQLARMCPGLSTASTYTDISITSLAQLLPQYSCLVDYVRFDYYSPGGEQREQRYLAMTVRPEGAADLVDMGPAQCVDSLVTAYRDCIDKASQEWPNLSQDVVNDGSVLCHALYERVWAPLEKSVANFDLVLIAPDAGLNLISFASLSDASGDFLIERQSLHYLSAARDLLRTGSEPTCEKSILAIGDPDFDAPVQARLESAVPSDTSESGGEYAALLRGFDWREQVKANRIPYTGREVRSVAELWENRFGHKATVLSGASASEENFKSLAPRTSMLHLATHGFYLSSPAGDSTIDSETDHSRPGSESESPLLRSGLLLAGANVQPERNQRVKDDGVLTAYEIASLDLSGLCCVVLSACNSALGKLQAGEGVYGLQRAFQTAGARTVISTLWPISDKETVHTMNRIYNSSEETLAATMRDAALERIAEIRKAGLPPHPFAWAAFRALGDWNKTF